jgi:ubiquinone/menaquinone biosynthesis C-methylase UbiE
MAAARPSVPVSVVQMYAGGKMGQDEIEALLDTSLDPRGPDLLFDLAGQLGADASATVLDVGCRDGTQLLELHRRFGCAGVGIDPVRANLDRAPAALRTSGLDLVLGIAESMPFADCSFDFVWVRDVLIHIERLRDALAECRRVARPGAALLVFQMFATPLLEPAEADRLWPSLAAVRANTDRDHFEKAVAAAGLTIEHRDELHGEWREYLEEHDRGRTSRQLLWASRLQRDPERYLAAMGDEDYAIELANCLWGVYQMVGKLSPAIYVLR